MPNKSAIALSLSLLFDPAFVRSKISARVPAGKYQWECEMIFRLGVTRNPGVASPAPGLFF